jgi:hypothetical protein
MSKVNFTGNGGDFPQDQMGALLQIALRTSEVGWAATTQVVVVITSNPFRIIDICAL